MLGKETMCACLFFCPGIPLYSYKVLWLRPSFKENWLALGCLWVRAWCFVYSAYLCVCILVFIKMLDLQGQPLSTGVTTLRGAAVCHNVVSGFESCFTSNCSFLFMYTLGCTGWWLTYLGPWHLCGRQIEFLTWGFCLAQHHLGCRHLQRAATLSL